MDNKKRVGVKMASLSPIMEEVVAAGGTFELTVTGNSMFPMLKNRVSRVKLSPAGQLKAGDLPLYRRDDGAFVLHRIIKYDGEYYSMCGDNQYVLERGIRPNQIIAVVTAFSRDGKKWTNSNNVLYMIYIRIWMFVRILKWFVQGVSSRLKRMLNRIKSSK